jgi:hypothetical protein
MKKGTTAKRENVKMEKVEDFISICKIDAEIVDSELFKGPFSNSISLIPTQKVILDTAMRYFFEN